MTTPLEDAAALAAGYSALVEDLRSLDSLSVASPGQKAQLAVYQAAAAALAGQDLSVGVVEALGSLSASIARVSVQIGGPTVSFIVPARIAAATVVRSPTVGGGGLTPQTLLPALLASTALVRAPTVSLPSGAQTVSPAKIASGTTVQTPTVTAGIAPTKWSATDNSTVGLDPPVGDPLSNGGLTATRSWAGAPDARGITNNWVESGKGYFEVTCVVAAGAAHHGFGLATENWVFTPGSPGYAYLGALLTSIGTFNNDRTYFNTSLGSSFHHSGSPVTVGVRFDWTEEVKAVKYTLDGETYTDPIDLSSMSGDRLYIAYDLETQDDAITVNCGGTAFNFEDGPTEGYSPVNEISLGEPEGGGGSGSPYTATAATLADVAADMVPGDVVRVYGEAIDLCVLNGMEWDAPGITVEGDASTTWTSANPSTGYAFVNAAGITFENGKIAEYPGTAMILYGEGLSRIVIKNVEYTTSWGSRNSPVALDWPTSTGSTGAASKGGVLHEGCHFHGLSAGISMQGGYGHHFNNCLFEDVWNDGITGNPQGDVSITNCTFRGFSGPALHSDAIQISTQGLTSSIDGLVIRDNIFERGPDGTPYQAIFCTNEGFVDPAFTNGDISRNAVRGCGPHGIDVQGNTSGGVDYRSATNFVIEDNFVQPYDEPGRIDWTNNTGIAATCTGPIYNAYYPYLGVNYPGDNFVVRNNTVWAISIDPELDGGGNVTIDPAADEADTTEYDAWKLLYGK